MGRADLPADLLTTQSVSAVAFSATYSLWGPGASPHCDIAIQMSEEGAKGTCRPLQNGASGVCPVDWVWGRNCMAIVPISYNMRPLTCCRAKLTWQVHRSAKAPYTRQKLAASFTLQAVARTSFPTLVTCAELIKDTFCSSSYAGRPNCRALGAALMRHGEGIDYYP